MGPATKVRKTIEDWEELMGAERAYFIDGEIYFMPPPTEPVHSRAQFGVSANLDPLTDYSGGKGTSGGPEWIILTEAWVRYLNDSKGFSHDLAGWKSHRYVAPAQGAHRVTPDWVCEILSPSNSEKDTIEIRSALQVEKVPHYWIVDPRKRLIYVFSIADDYREPQIFKFDQNETPVIPPFPIPMVLRKIFPG